MGLATTLLAAPAAQAPAGAPRAPDQARAGTRAPNQPPDQITPVPGHLLERLSCAADPSQSYALYIPSTYRSDRDWPIVYALDAGGRAMVPAELLRPAAERYGYVVASSYNSASDGPLAPNLAAMKAMWNDTHGRLRIDDRRVYGAGFSGTVRSLCVLAKMAPGTFAGILGAGAGFPAEQPPAKDVSFAFFGTAGNRDFNYDEMVLLDEKLTDLALPHRVEFFDGTHQWPPEALASRALAWMELQAIRSHRRSPQAAFVDALWRQENERAAAAAAAGQLFDAWRSYAALAADFAGLRGAGDLEAVARQATGLLAQPALAQEIQARRARVKRDEEYVARAQRIVGGALAAADADGSDPASQLPKALAELSIADLKSKASGAPDLEERLSAQRKLSSVKVQTGFYLPGMFAGRKQYDRALFCLSIAAEIAPDDPYLWYQMASAQARRGNAKQALKLLARAVDSGWRDRAQLESDPAFESLRRDELYRKLVERLGALPTQPS
ncbi:MAG TPA: hypothetical protein VHR45_14915 [Thermoanaerobaculia bacterium]|nr:hypothetical protein [Thermoanaerobaculia bacterium]